MSSDDVFLQRGLGKSAGEVWQVLQEQAATVNELSKLTGRHPRTNKRAIRRMMDLPDLFTGEYLPMAASEDGIVFYSLPVDLDALARILGTAGLGKRQMEKHRKERFAHRQSLLAGRKNIKQDPQTSRDNRDV